MSTATTSPPNKLTAADLSAMPDEKNFELIDGQLVERTVGSESSKITARLLAFLLIYCDKANLGTVFGPDTGYQCFSHDSQRIRRPDVSYLSFERFAEDEPNVGYIPIPPDLAAEVVSPGDLALEVDNKVAEYLAAGVRLVWVIYPTTGQVLVYNSAGGRILSLADELSGEDVIPGFRLKISELLRKPGE